MKKILFFLLILGLSPLSLSAGDSHIGAVYEGNVTVVGRYNRSLQVFIRLTVEYDGSYLMEAFPQGEGGGIPFARQGAIDFFRNGEVEMPQVHPNLFVQDQSIYGWSGNRPWIEVRQIVVGAGTNKYKELFLHALMQGTLQRVSLLPHPGAERYQIDTKVTQKSNNSTSSTQKDTSVATVSTYEGPVAIEGRSLKVTRASDGQVAYICLENEAKANALLDDIERGAVTIEVDDDQPLLNLLLYRGDMISLPDVNDTPCK